MLFDTFQDTLYANDPAINTPDKGEKSSQRSRAGSAISRSSGKSQVDKPSEAMSANESSQGENRVMYEESILMTMLGPDYI